MPTDRTDREALVAVLARARELRNQIAKREPGPGSPAAHDLEQCEQVLGTRRPVERTIVCGDLWTAVAADQLYSVSLLLNDGTTGFGLFPLLRSVLEHSALVIWILDERVSAPVRGARATSCVLRSAENGCQAASHMHGRSSDAYRRARERLERIQGEIELEEAGYAEHALGSIKQPPPKPSDVINDYGERRGTPKVWGGIYDFLCNFGTHPNLDALDLANITDDGVLDGFVLRQELVRRICGNTIQAYQAALAHLGEYMGWEWKDAVATYASLVDGIVVDAERADGADPYRGVARRHPPSRHVVSAKSSDLQVSGQAGRSFGSGCS